MAKSRKYTSSPGLSIGVGSEYSGLGTSIVYFIHLGNSSILLIPSTGFGYDLYENLGYSFGAKVAYQCFKNKNSYFLTASYEKTRMFMDSSKNPYTNALLFGNIFLFHSGVYLIFEYGFNLTTVKNDDTNYDKDFQPVGKKTISFGVGFKLF